MFSECQFIRNDIPQCDLEPIGVDRFLEIV